MNLEIIRGTEEELALAIPYPECERSMPAYKNYVKDRLARAGESGEKTARMRSIPMTERASDYFEAVNWIEQAIREFQSEHELPEKVCIVCDTQQTAELYKAVFNFYYADSKAARL